MSAHGALFNGAPVDAALAGNRGLHYGDGVFRTMLRNGGAWLDWSLHRDKLAADAQALALAAPPAELLAGEAEIVARAHPRCVLKIILTRAAHGRGYTPASRAAERWLSVHPAPAHPPAHWSAGVRAAWSPVRLAAQPLLAGIKHLNRLEQVLASRDWPPGVAECILCDEAGAPVCGTRSNLFWVSRGVLHTPVLDRCGVAGVMRARILAAARVAGILTKVGKGSRAALLAAEEVFLSNSLIGIWPVRALDARVWPAPGPVTQALARALAHPRLEAAP